MAYSEITNAQVAAGASINTALMTALRDNIIAVAERAAGAPVVVGAIYDYQEFLTSGTWTKPANAESGDVVYIWLVGGGGGGAADSTNIADAGGGQGGTGRIFRIDDIDDLASTENVVVGSGGGTRTGNSNGLSGGNSAFGTASTAARCVCYGGNGGLINEDLVGDSPRSLRYEDGQTKIEFSDEGRGGNRSSDVSFGSIYGGAGGGGSVDPDASLFPAGYGATSQWGGSGGNGQSSGNGQAGSFPGGGGAGTRDGTSGAGANGVVRVWCIRES